MPTLDPLQAELGRPGFEVVALSIDRAGPEVVRRFNERTGVDHLALYIDETGRAANTLSAFGLPLTVLIDAEGRELGRRLRHINAVRAGTCDCGSFMPRRSRSNPRMRQLGIAEAFDGRSGGAGG